MKTDNPRRNAVCLAVIPARGGSKRVLHKNIRLIAGKPMIAYAIEAARQSGLFEQVVVSTDSDEIAEEARRYGADVPFMRSRDLADDVTHVSAVTVDALERLDPEGIRYQYVVQLMANCPLRTADDIQESYQGFIASGSEAQLSVAPYGWQNPWWALQLGKDRQMQPLFAEQLKQRSQDLPELFCPTGAVWWATAEALRRHRTFHIEGRTGWSMPWEHALDIDTEEDLRLAELMFQIRQESKATAGLTAEDNAG